MDFHSLTPKQFNSKVMEKMKNNGSFLKLHSKFLSIVSQEAQKSNIIALRPYRNFYESLYYQIANEMIFHYLESHNFYNSIESMKSESNNKFPIKISTKYIQKLKLKNIKKPIQDLIKNWNADVSNSFYLNRDDLSNRIKERLLLIESKNQINENKKNKNPIPIKKWNNDKIIDPITDDDTSNSTINLDQEKINQNKYFKNIINKNTRIKPPPNIPNPLNSSISFGDIED